MTKMRINNSKTTFSSELKIEHNGKREKFSPQLLTEHSRGRVDASKMPKLTSEIKKFKKFLDNDLNPDGEVSIHHFGSSDFDQKVMVIEYKQDAKSRYVQTFLSYDSIEGLGRKLVESIFSLHNSTQFKK